jgi:HK97 family phage portal protein
MIQSGGSLVLEERSVVPADLTDPGYGYGQDSWGWQGGWGQGMVWQGPAAGPGMASQTAIAQSMRLSAVFACLRLLSEAIATLPLDTFVRNGAARKPYRPRPDYLSFQPPQASRIDYLSQIVLSLLTDGNAYVLTPRDALGVPVDLVVLDPTLIEVQRIQGKLVYTARSLRLDPATDLMHIKGMTLPGQVKGLSPIGYARETIGVGLAAQRFGASFFENGALPGAVIEADEMSKAAAERFRESWNGDHQGVGNAHRIGVLTGGAKLSKVSVNPNDSQFLETRQFQVPDVARIFGVPPHLIADASNSTSWGSGLAEQNLAFAQFSLRPWLERIEDAHSRLLTSHGLDRVFVKLNLDALLRASLKDRYEAYKLGVESHIDTVNECRALEDKSPVPWGDEPYVVERITETGPIPGAAGVPAPVEPGPTPPQPKVLPPAPPRRVPVANGARR